MSKVGAPDVIVVGGGAVGCATALELSKRGLAVTLVERDSVGSHASGFAYGGLYATTGIGIPGPVLGPAKEAVERHADLARELKDITGIDTEFRAAPSIDLAEDETEMAGLRRDAEWQQREGFDAEVLSAGEVRSYEGSLSANVVGGLLQRSHFEVDSYRYTLALATACEKHGGVLRHGTVARILECGGRVSGVGFASGDTLAAGMVVLADGPWAATGEIDGVPKLPVRPMKGEILRLRFPGADFRYRVVSQGHYVARKPDGLVWAGSTYEDAGFDDRPSKKARDSIMKGVLDLAPVLETAMIVQHTACLRPVSSDGLPVIGAAGDALGVYVVNGAGKKGILLSPVMASMVAGLVMGQPEEAPVPSEWSTERFA